MVHWLYRSYLAKHLGNFTLRSAYLMVPITSPLAYNEAVLFIRGGMANFDVDGWDVCTFKFEVSTDPTGAILNNVSLNSTRKGWSTGGSVPNSAYFEIKNYRGNDVEADFSVWSSVVGLLTLLTPLGLTTPLVTLKALLKSSMT